MLLTLAGLAWTVAALVLLRSRYGRTGLIGRITQVAVAVFTSAALFRALLGCWWAFTPGSLPSPFYWLNLLFYTPACLALFIAGMSALGSSRCSGRPSWLRRLLTARVAAVTLPSLALAGLLSAAFLYVPQVQSDYSPHAELGAVRSRFLDTPLARFHYVREGTGSPIVLLSPGSAWLAAWLPQMHALAATHTVYAVDLPGQGFTRLHDHAFTFDLKGMTRAIASFLDAAGLRHVTLAGNSWSGGWALAFAQADPQRVAGLVLLAPSGLVEADPISWELLKLPLVGRALTHLAAGSEAVTRSGLMDLFVHQSRVTPAIMDAMWAPNTFPDNLRSVYELEQNLNWTTTQDTLPRTQVHTLIIWGREDHVLPVAQAATFDRLMPDAEVRVLGGCGHALTLDCRDRVNKMMKGFLDGR